MKCYKSTFILFFLLSLFVLNCKHSSTNNSKEIIKTPIEKVFYLGGAPITLKVQLSATTLQIIDYLYLKVIVEAPEDYIIHPFNLESNVYEPFLLVTSPQEKTEQLTENSVRWKTELLYKLEPTHSGKSEIKPFSITFQKQSEKPTNADEEWKQYQISSEPIEINVTSSLQEGDTNIRDIQGKLQQPFDWKTFGIGLGATFLFLSLSLFIIYFFPKRKTPPQEVKEVNYTEWAKQAMLELEKKDLISQGKVEEFHVELSKILRHFLEKTYHLKIEEQTTEEFLHEATNSSQFSPQEKEMLQKYLRAADLVKFAGFSPEQEENYQAMQTVFHIIENSQK